MNLPTEESTGSEYHVIGKKTQPHLGDHTPYLILLDYQIITALLEDPQVRLVFQHMTNGRLVQHPVRLGTGCPYGRALTAVEDTELDTRSVGSPRHGATQGVNFLDQVTLADATNGRVTAHLAECFDVMAEQQGFYTHAGSRQRGLGTSMAATHHNHVKTIRKIQRTPRCPVLCRTVGKRG